MLVEGHNTATPLSVIVRRARSDRGGEVAMPEPLADPLMDLRVHSATAEAYLVRAGD